ncbi:MAG: glycoside hydrolase family 30 beta sandwich domain-containing protein [Kofleriaceae bacterium]
MQPLARATIVLLLGAAATVHADVQVVIDNGKPHQTMQGFGATTLSLVYNATDNVPAELRTQAIDALYHQVQLTMGNLEVEPFEAPASNVYAPANDDASAATFGAFNWVQSDNMMQKVVTPGAAFGFDHYWIGPVISTGFALSWAPALRASSYQRYLDELAEHVAAVAIHWRDQYGVTPAYMQLFNEPLSGNGELAGGSVAEIIDIIKRCGNRLRAERFATMKFVVTAEETEAISLRDAQMILADPEARSFVGAIAYHPYPYGSTYASVPNILATSGTGAPDLAKVTLRNQLRDLGAQYGIPTMMVEVSHSEVPFDSFDGVRGRAIQIHDELTYADATAFFGMNAMWDSTSHAQHYQGRPDPGFYSETDSIVLIDNAMKKVVISPMGRAIGHYARWIKRGAVRIEATSDDPLVQVSAFRDEAQGRMVLVAVNNADVSRTLAVTTLSAPTLAGTVTGERSTASIAWEPFTGPAAPTGWSLELPARSVTSMAQAMAAPNPDGMPATGSDAGGGSGWDPVVPVVPSGGCCDGGRGTSGGGLALGVLIAGLVRRLRGPRD